MNRWPLGERIKRKKVNWMDLKPELKTVSFGPSFFFT